MQLLRCPRSITTGEFFDDHCGFLTKIRITSQVYLIKVYEGCFVVHFAKILCSKDVIMDEYFGKIFSRRLGDFKILEV